MERSTDRLSRTVRLDLDPAVPPYDKDRYHAIGYLSSWAIGSLRYVSVDIYEDRRGELQATYRDAENNVTYFMAGVRRDDGTYSFHS